MDSHSRTAPTSIVPIQIRDDYDTLKVKEEFWYCDCGSREIAKILGIHDDWALWMACQSGTCYRTWYVCNRCPDSRKKITGRDALKRHHKQQHKRAGGMAGTKRKYTTCHKKSKNGVTVSTIAVTGILEQHEDEHSFPFVCANDENFIQETDVSMGGQVLVETTASVFVPFRDNEINWTETTDPWCSLSSGNRASLAYFQHCHLGGAMAGRRYLVKRSICQKKFQNEELQQMDTPDSQVGLFLEMAMLCYNLSSTHHPSLARVFNGIWRMGLEDGHAQTERELQRRFTGIVGDDHNIDVIRQDLAQQKMPISVPFEELIPNDKAYVWGAPMPIVTNDFRKYFFDGRSCIKEHLPVPIVKEDIRGHAYVSIIDCIRDFFAHGKSQIAAITNRTEVTISGEPIVRHSSESTRAQAILSNGKQVFSNQMKDPPICSYLVFWSDDFEPNALSKSGRGSAWVKTMTIATTKENGHRINNTYAIAMGRKGLDHDPVEEKINAELDLLMSGTLPPFYIGGNTKKCVHVYFELLVTLQDQPERRSANHLGMGNSTYTTRFGVSADHSALYGKLQSCDACLRVMSQRYREGQWDLPLPNCTECLNWDVLKESVHARTPVHEHYPVEPPFYSRTVTVDGKVYLKPFRIEYDKLRNALTFAHEKFCMTDGWSIENLRQFLKVEGMNTDIINSTVEHAINSQALRVLGCDEMPILLSDFQKNPKKYERYPDPPLWTRNNVPLSTHIDAIMHLLFLGLVKSVVHAVALWMKALNKHNSFIDANAKRLDVFKSMTVDWLAVLPYTAGKLGAWVSENYLGFSRISLWFYQNIEEAPAHNENEPPDGVNQKDWLVKHNKYWLKVRGLDTEGKADVLKARVQTYMAKKHIPKPKQQPVRKVEDVENTIVSLVNVLQCVMASEVTPSLVSKTEYAVRIFLNAFDKLNVSLPREKTVRNKKAEKVQVGEKESQDEENEEAEENESSSPPQKVNQKVTETHNCMCLLNIPAAMSTYGPLRDLWEGGPRGEGILRFIKPLLQQGLQQNWQTNLLQKVLIKQSIENVMIEEAKSTSSLFSASALKDRSTKYHKYKSQLEVTHDVRQCTHHKKNPVSVILLDDGKGKGCLYCVVKDYETLVEISLNDVDCPTRDKFGLTYHKFNIADSTSSWTAEIVPSLGASARIGYGILLPLLDAEDMTERSRLFALASSNWMYLTPLNTTLDLIGNDS